MTTLGIWDGHGAGAAMVGDQGLSFALSEERPLRLKRARGFPKAALAACLERSTETPTLIAIAGRAGRLAHRLLDGPYRRTEDGGGPLSPSGRAARVGENLIARLPVIRYAESHLSRALLRHRLSPFIDRSIPLRLVDHHTAHAASAGLCLDGPGLLVSMDAYGDGLSGRWFLRTDAGMTSLGELPCYASPALLYGAVTTWLGFSEGDEGKVTALAAHGDPGEVASAFRSLLETRDGAPDTSGLHLSRASLDRHLSGHHPRDVAAGLQARVEEVVAPFVLGLAVRHRVSRLALAGGLFANVALNRRIAEGFDGDLLLFPAMGDEGLAAGAAAAVHLDMTGHWPPPLGLPLLGTQPVPTALPPTAVRLNDPAEALTGLIDSGRAVAIVQGREEYGPRALGARSLLFRADDPALADSVQRRLGRDPLMPFCPLCRVEDLDDCFEGPWPAPSRTDRGLGWMTVAVRARDAVRTSSPTAVHADGTARVQAVDRRTSPLLHDVLTRFASRTGQPLLINTSFNLHGDPIVHGSADALETLAAGAADAMLLGDHLVPAGTP